MKVVQIIKKIIFLKSGFSDRAVIYKNTSATDYIGIQVTILNIRTVVQSKPRINPQEHSKHKWT